jgi:mannosyltransferase
VRAVLERIRLHRTPVRGLAILGLILAVAAFLRFWALGRQGLWFDEARTAWFMHGTPGQMLRALPRTESTPPLYYLAAWGWSRIFGDTELGLRSLSALVGVFAVALAYAAGRTLATRRVGHVAAALVAVNPFLVWYSQEARAYSLLVFLGALSFWLFARARANPTPKALAAWAFASALALWTHYSAAFLVVPELALLLAGRRPQLGWRLGASAAVGAVGLALLPMAHQERSHTPWIRQIPLHIRVDQIVHDFAVGFPPAAGRLAVVLAGIAGIVAVALLAARADPGEQRAAAIAAIVGIAAIALPLLLALAGTDYLDARNVIAALVPLAVVAAAGLGARRAGTAGLAAVVLATVVSVSVVVRVATHSAYQKLHWRQVAAALGPARAPRAILLAPNTGALSLAFYMPHTWWVTPAGMKVAELDLVRRLPGLPQCSWAWWGAACHYARGHPALRRPPAAGFHLVSSRRVAGFEIARYVAPRPVRLYPERPFARRPLHVPRKQLAATRQLLVSPRQTPLFP